MGLVPGECIRAVNGLQVSNEKELYDAIQINAAHCRLASHRPRRRSAAYATGDLSDMIITV